MTDRAALDAALAENLRLTVQLQEVMTENGDLRLRILYLERLRDGPPGKNMQAFTDQRDTALNNAKRGVAPFTKG